MVIKAVKLYENGYMLQPFAMGARIQDYLPALRALGYGPENVSKI